MISLQQLKNGFVFILWLHLIMFTVVYQFRAFQTLNADKNRTVTTYTAFYIDTLLMIAVLLGGMYVYDLSKDERSKLIKELDFKLSLSSVVSAFYLTFVFASAVYLTVYIAVVSNHYFYLHSVGNDFVMVLCFFWIFLTFAVVYITVTMFPYFVIDRYNSKKQQEEQTKIDDSYDEMLA